jgi:hypothetical protein
LYYARGYVGKGRIYMHREVINAPVDCQVDHVNHDGLDNRRDNLRLCTVSQNQGNSRKQNRETTSRYKGVSWHSRDRRWRAQIRYGKEKVHLGQFLSEEEAAYAYDRAARNRWGEFANINGERGYGGGTNRA